MGHWVSLNRPFQPTPGRDPDSSLLLQVDRWSLSPPSEVSLTWYSESGVHTEGEKLILLVSGNVKPFAAAAFVEGEKKSASSSSSVCL